MSVDPKHSANSRKGKNRSPWSWGPHVPRAKNFERNRQYRHEQRTEDEDHHPADNPGLPGT